MFATEVNLKSEFVGAPKGERFLSPEGNWRLETVETREGERGEKWVHRWGNEAVEHDTLSASVCDIACSVQPGWDLRKLKGIFGQDLGTPFERWLGKKNCAALMSELGVPTYVVGLTTTGGPFVRLVCDARHFSNLPFSRVCVILLGTRGEYLGLNPGVANLPPLLCPLQKSCKPLKELLGHSTDRPDPRTLEEVKTYFEAEELSRIHCTMLFVGFVLGKKKARIWERLFFGDISNCEKSVHIEARAGIDHLLVFRMCPDVNVAPEEPAPPSPERNSRDRISARNRSSCVKVSRSGLNLAFDLGLIDKIEAGRISETLGKTAGVLVLLCDSEKCPRYLRYVDRGGPFGAELSCRSDERRNVDNFFAKVAAAGEKNSKARSDALAALLIKLDACAGGKTNLFATCARTLRLTIAKQRIVVCSPDDFDLHHLKLLYAQYFYGAAKKGCKAKVRLCFTPGNDLTAFYTNSCLVLNVANFLEVKDDPEYLALASGAPQLAHLARLAGDKLKAAAAHADRAGAWALDLWTAFTQNCFRHFGHEMNASWCASLPNLCYSVAQAKILQKCGPLDVGSETLKPFYGRLLRKWSRGGFVSSCCSKFTNGDSLDETGYTAQSLLELDVNASYGYCCSSADIPGGFCVGFVSRNFETADSSVEFENKPWGRKLLKRDGERWRQYEFKAAYATLLQILRESDKEVRAVFSNFSRRGLFFVGKCIFDLAVVFEDGSLMLWNFDPQYTHGCRNCPTLRRHVDGFNPANVRIRTLERDAEVRSWLSSSAVKANYTVLSDCHDPGYSVAALDSLFETEPELFALKQVVPAQRSLEPCQMTRWLLQHRKDPALAFIAWMTGSQPHKNFTSFVVNSKKISSVGQELLSGTGDTPALVTKEHFNYLVDKFGFRPEGIQAVLFFKTDKLTSAVYGELTEERFQSSDPRQIAFLKKVLNLSIGFFGLNENKPRTQFKLDTIPRGLFNRALNTWNCDKDQPLIQNSNMFLATWTKPARPRKSGCLRPPNALAAYVAVVERGKLRIIELLNFFQKFLPRGSFKLLYCNTDGVHLAFAAESYRQLVPKHLLEEFEREEALLVAKEKVPGLFKLEWHVKGDFRYVTAQIYNYAVVGEGVLSSKWSGVKALTPLEHYSCLCRLLETGSVEVPQQRRTDKRNTLDVVDKKLVFKRRKCEIATELSCE